jgi:hypothetical protein
MRRKAYGSGPPQSNPEPHSRPKEKAPASPVRRESRARSPHPKLLHCSLSPFGRSPLTMPACGGYYARSLGPCQAGSRLRLEHRSNVQRLPPRQPLDSGPCVLPQPAAPLSPRPAAILPDRITCPQEIRRMLRSFPTGTPQRRLARWPPNLSAKPATIPPPNRGTLKIVLSCDDCLGTINS